MNRKKETKIEFLKNARCKAIILKILYIIIILCVILNIIFLINSTIKKIDYFNLMGISLFSMESDSMGKEIPKNSLVITREYRNNDIDINDNIVYKVNGKIRINKVVSIELTDGKIIYHTKSNNNYNMDKEGISKNEVIGNVINVIPGVGILLKILQSKITTILILFFLVLKYMYNKRVYKNRVRRKVNLYKKKERETFNE